MPHCRYDATLRYGDVADIEQGRAVSYMMPLFYKSVICCICRRLRAMPHALMLFRD